MEVEWDETKRAEVIREREVDILEAALIFEGHVLTRVDRRNDYGEERKISVGMVGENCFVVIHTERGGRMRLITAWKGGRNERRKYQASIARGTTEDEGQG